MKSQIPTGIGQVTLSVDRSDRTYKALTGFVARIAKLLNEPAVRANPHLFGTLDDLLGAVYALIFAKQNNFTDRPRGSIESTVVQKRAEQLAAGTVRTDGKWMAGFHFNSALFRIAAVYHRTLKIAVGRLSTTEKVPQLRAEATQLYRQWRKAQWSRHYLDTIHAQVNTLKHAPQGVFHRRTVKYQDAVRGVGELLDLIDAWNGRKS